MKTRGFLYRANGTNRGGSLGLQTTGAVAHGIVIPSLKTLQGLGCECLGSLGAGGDWDPNAPTLYQWQAESQLNEASLSLPPAIVNPVTSAAAPMVMAVGAAPGTTVAPVVSPWVSPPASTVVPTPSAPVPSPPALNCTPGSDSAMDPLSQSVACSLQVSQEPVSNPPGLSPVNWLLAILLGIAILT
jgi:hypothetical protein